MSSSPEVNEIEAIRRSVRSPTEYRSQEELFLRDQVVRLLDIAGRMEPIVTAALVIDEASRNPRWEGWSQATAWDCAFDQLAEAVDHFTSSKET